MMKSTVVEIGQLALAFLEEKVIVLFGPKAPEQLKEVSIIHEVASQDGDLKSEVHHFVVDGAAYDILKIGSAAMANLVELGHLSVYFTEPPEDILPGAIYVQPSHMPTFRVGSVIEIR